MHDVLGAFGLLALALVFLGYVLWAASDAKHRGKSAVLVLIAVVGFFPFGLIAWLLFRPPQREHRVLRRA